MAWNGNMNSKDFVFKMKEILMSLYVAGKDPGKRKKTWKNGGSVSHSVMYDSLQPMDCSPQGFSVHGILQARILEWVAIPFSRRSPWPRDQAQVPCIAGRFVIIWATREASIHGVAESNTAEWLTQESRYLYWHNSLYLGQLIGCWYKKYHIFSNVKEIFERKGEGGRKRKRKGGGLKTEMNKCLIRDFPGSPEVKTALFHCRGHRFNPRWGN